jgi:transposase
VSLLQASSCMSCPSDLVLLLPHLRPVVVERVEVREGGVHGGLVLVQARVASQGARCRGCQEWCTGRHGCYVRTLRDSGTGGQRTVIRLLVRLLVCGNPDCPVVTFAEQPEGLTVPYARVTTQLSAQLAAVTVALAGRAGSRLARVVLAVKVSRRTLIRKLMAMPDPPAGLVRVLGVDDFSLRRGKRYATLLVDMETGRPVDVLLGRDAGTLQQWLEEHPGTEVICRDRASAYAEGARAGAPDAVQVADRWHLWHNLCEYVRAEAARHRSCVTGTGQPCQHPGAEQEQERGPEQDRSLEEWVTGLEDIIRGRYQQVQQIRAAGQTLGQAAVVLGLGTAITSRYWNAGSAADLLAVRGSSALDPFKPRLRQRWEQGSTKISDLYREITADGYQGSYTTAWNWLAIPRLAAPPKPPAPPTTAQVTALLTADPATQDQDSRDQASAILARCPALTALTPHITGFARLITGLYDSTKAGGKLDTWLAAAETAPGQPGLHSLARGIRQDYQAVRNAVTLPWSSGPVEGLNTRTKLLLRQMYGRAGFPLLRKRILTTEPPAP